MRFLKQKGFSMPKIYPFKAFRYSGSSKKIARLVCPPYDVIGASLERNLRKIKNNAIQVELPQGRDLDKYANAKKIWQAWVKEKVVQQDQKSSFYIYEQIFNKNGKSASRKGFFCELEVEKPGEGSVLRHELTLSKPKEDRLNLLKALQMNTSSIFGMFKDPMQKVGKILNDFSKKNSLIEFKDKDQVCNRIWALTEMDLQNVFQETLKKSPVLIADGHHRYETAWNYSQAEKQLAGSKRTLFYLCSMEDEGLLIYPTHRVLAPKGEGGKVIFKRLLERLNSLKDVFWVKPASEESAKDFSFILSYGREKFSVGIHSLSALKNLFPNKSGPYLKFPLVHLHSVFLPQKKKEDFIYTHQEKEALQIAKKLDSVALLTPPVSSKELYQIVSQGELMPQKSTYFYPKLLTGLVFRSL